MVNDPGIGTDLLELISTTIAPSPTASLLAQVPPGYTNLRLLVQGRSTSVNALDQWGLVVNQWAIADRYLWQSLDGTDTTLTLTSGTTGEQRSVLGQMPGAAATTGASGVFEIDIPNYDSPTYMPAMVSAGGSETTASLDGGTFLQTLGTVPWLSNVSAVLDDGQWAIGSMLQLWGDLWTGIPAVPVAPIYAYAGPMKLTGDGFLVLPKRKVSLRGNAIMLCLASPDCLPITGEPDALCVNIGPAAPSELCVYIPPPEDVPPVCGCNVSQWCVEITGSAGGCDGILETRRYTITYAGITQVIIPGVAVPGDCVWLVTSRPTFTTNTYLVYSKTYATWTLVITSGFTFYLQQMASSAFSCTATNTFGSGGWSSACHVFPSVPDAQITVTPGSCEGSGANCCGTCCETPAELCFQVTGLNNAPYPSDISVDLAYCGPLSPPVPFMDTVSCSWLTPGSVLGYYFGLYAGQVRISAGFITGANTWMVALFTTSNELIAIWSRPINETSCPWDKPLSLTYKNLSLLPGAPADIFDDVTAMLLSGSCGGSGSGDGSGSGSDGSGSGSGSGSSGPPTPGDTCDEAGTISVGETVTGTAPDFSSGGDWYAVNLESGQEYHVSWPDVDPTNGSLNVYSGNCAGLINLVTIGAFITCRSWTASYTGTYYVQVWANMGMTVDYSFTIDTGPCP